MERQGLGQRLVRNERAGQHEAPRPIAHCIGLARRLTALTRRYIEYRQGRRQLLHMDERARHDAGITYDEIIRRCRSYRAWRRWQEER